MAQMPEDVLARLAAEAAIREVLARYCHAIDDGDLAALGACFADDAELHAFGRERTGREAITALLDKALPADRRGKHLTTNTVIDDVAAGPDGNPRAHARSDFAFLGPDGSTTTGRYEDDLAAVGGHWRITTRRIMLRE
ncbi:MAG: nuclear transport factor 2 family protein [Actinomycetota bacterium]|nr:nuclear transport factor 2 family protein [Actinomycetota bacterium]